MATIDVSYTSENNAAFLPPLRVTKESGIPLEIIGVPDESFVNSVVVSLLNADGEALRMMAEKNGSSFFAFIPSSFYALAGKVQRGVMIVAEVTVNEETDYWVLGVGDTEIVNPVEVFEPNDTDEYTGETATDADSIADFKAKFNDVVLWLNGISQND